jgi:hypothetical protein
MKMRKQADSLKLRESPLYVIKKWEPGTHFHEQKHEFTYVECHEPLQKQFLQKL